MGITSDGDVRGSGKSMFSSRFQHILCTETLGCTTSFQTVLQSANDRCHRVFFCMKKNLQVIKSKMPFNLITRPVIKLRIKKSPPHTPTQLFSLLST